MSVNTINIEGVKEKEDKEIELTSPMTGETYKGIFTWRRRTLLDNGEISARMSEIVGGTPIVEAGMRNVIHAMATLDIVLQKTPDWWKQLCQLGDNASIQRVYLEYERWLRLPFRKDEEQEDKKE